MNRSANGRNEWLSINADNTVVNVAKMLQEELIPLKLFPRTRLCCLTGAVVRKPCSSSRLPVESRSHSWNNIATLRMPRFNVLERRMDVQFTRGRTKTGDFGVTKRLGTSV